MLDPWIIKEILRREEEKREEEGAYVELPLEMPLPGESRVAPQPQPKEERGVVVIDI